MGFLTQLWQLFGEYSKANPVVGGLVGLFGMSVVSFLLVKCPKRIWDFLKHRDDPQGFLKALPRALTLVSNLDTATVS